MTTKQVKLQMIKLIDFAHDTFVPLARVEIGLAIQSILNNDMPDPDKLELISKYAESYSQGRMHDDT